MNDAERPNSTVQAAAAYDRFLQSLGTAVNPAEDSDQVEALSASLDDQLARSRASRGRPAEAFDPIDALFAAVRRRAPRLAVSVVKGQNTSPRLQISYRHRGPYRVDHRDVGYVWRDGPRPGEVLPQDAEDAADRIAAVLGAAPVSPGP